jgi:hypothetical protein
MGAPELRPLIAIRVEGGSEWGANKLRRLRAIAVCYAAIW